MVKSTPTGAFPLPLNLQPRRLTSLLTPVDNQSPQEPVEVAERFDHRDENGDREYIHMNMVAIPTESPDADRLLRISEDGVVAFSVPVCDSVGDVRDFAPSCEGHDCIVTSWGDGSFGTYALSEKVWTSLGLSVRLLGGDEQRIVYDDLSLPELDIASGDVFYEHFWKPNRNISWTMRNDYLRRYLWMRGMVGARAFFYEKLMNDTPDLRSLMGGQKHYREEPNNGWYRIDIREHLNGLLLQVWATVRAVSPELCPSRDANGLIWPGKNTPTTHQSADADTSGEQVFLNDKFLQRYENNPVFDAIPVRVFDHWNCSPSYRGEWSFTECRRVGRNMIRVPLRELYKPKPEREILHAFDHAIPAPSVGSASLAEEHIVEKTDRLIKALITAGQSLADIASTCGHQSKCEDFIGISRSELAKSGWRSSPELIRLARVAPLEMPIDEFTSRCKVIHELVNRRGDKHLRAILETAGIDPQDLKGLGRLKLLQALLNVLQEMDSNGVSRSQMPGTATATDWRRRNPALATLFHNNDLRIADAHVLASDVRQHLQDLGFETASLATGYGRALDHIIDGTSASLGIITETWNRIAPN